VAQIVEHLPDKWKPSVQSPVAHLSKNYKETNTWIPTNGHKLKILIVPSTDDVQAWEATLQMYELVLTMEDSLSNWEAENKYKPEKP
jgi:hypothetical protein